MDIDHVVLWVESPKRALEFYVGVLGLAPVRARDFKEERASFPSVRLNETTIFDLMDRSKVSGVRKFTGGGGDSGGAPLNHVCLSMDASDYASLTARLVEHGVELMSGGRNRSGPKATPSTPYTSATRTAMFWRYGITTKRPKWWAMSRPMLKSAR